MRADRLIALLLFLQRRGKVTAAEVATELEVSERTARRDLESLAMGGVPVYSRHGRGGGWQLIGGATTDLTGLSIEEAKALFLATGPAIDQSGPELRSAMEKLASAIPETFRQEAESASSAIKVDIDGWGQLGSNRPPPLLDQLIDAVVTGHQIDIDYRDRQGRQGRRNVHPLGLVTKRNTWYLVADTAKGIRTFRVGRILDVDKLDDLVCRPDGFDLDTTWAEIVTEVESHRLPIEVTALVDPTVINPARAYLGSQIRIDGQVEDGRFRVTVGGHAPLSLAAQLSGFGAAIELIDPPAEIVAHLARIGAELSERYGTYLDPLPEAAHRPAAT